MDKVLKQRLVGAVILIALAVIFVPMLFDERPEREGVRDSVIDLPPPPADRREVRRLPLDPQQAREVPPPPEVETAVPERVEPEISLLEPDRAVADEAPVSAPDDAHAALEPEPSVEPDSVSEPAPSPEPEPSVAPSDPGGAFIVQIGSFSSGETAGRITEQLGRLGHDASADLIVRGDSRLHRVRTGPYTSRADADRARTQIAATVAGIEPVVLSAPAGLEAPPQRSAGLSVQVGSFTARVNADRLTEQLLEQGFDAFIHPDETGPRDIWRVRVGSLGSREEAASLRRELLERAGLEGLIVNHP